MKKDKKIVNFSFTVDNNLQTGRSIIHNINYVYSDGITNTLTVQYSDGTEETFSEYKPNFKLRKLDS